MNNMTEEEKQALESVKSMFEYVTMERAKTIYTMIGENMVNMNKLSAGEYVRLKRGDIFKIDEDTANYYNSNKEFITNEIVKHSKNIAELLEIGDYVNGERVVNEIWGEDDNNLYFEIEGGYNKATYIGNKDIKSIVTHEQMKEMEYRV